MLQTNAQHAQQNVSPLSVPVDQSQSFSEGKDQSQALLQQHQSQAFMQQQQQHQSNAILQQHKERLMMQKEMKSLQQNLVKGRMEIKSIETQIKENRAKAEDAR